MKLKTLEVERKKNFPKGYGSMSSSSESSPDTLNTIVTWSQGKNVDIYKHIMRYEYENDKGKYKFVKGEWNSDTHPQTVECDYVTYVDVYYQKRKKGKKKSKKIKLTTEEIINRNVKQLMENEPLFDVY